MKVDDISTFLRMRRAEKHISISELARATGLSRKTIYNYENGYSGGTIGSLIALGKVLDFEIQLEKE